jgi:hypothetical protein
VPCLPAKRRSTWVVYDDAAVGNRQRRNPSALPPDARVMDAMGNDPRRFSPEARRGALDLAARDDHARTIVEVRDSGAQGV